MSTHEEVIIIGLLFEPICFDENCPMKAAYALPLKERFAWAQNLSQMEKRQIITHYYECIERLDDTLLKVGTNSDVQSVSL